jgi:hypothetical protein
MSHAIQNDEIKTQIRSNNGIVTKDCDDYNGLISAMIAATYIIAPHGRFGCIDASQYEQILEKGYVSSDTSKTKALSASAKADANATYRLATTG